MKVFDCIIYLDEDLLLDLRFNILNNFVDYFVIVESNKTWQNNFKKFNFHINNFSKFAHKIIYVKVEDMPDGANPWLRENFQRNCIIRGLNNAKDNDLIIISDADEIPSPAKILEFNIKKKFAVFLQDHYCYKFNLLNSTFPKWNGSKICVKKYLLSPQWLRELKIKRRPFWRIDKYFLKYVIENGGWHFCNLKTPEQLSYKYKNLCETNDGYAFFNKIDLGLLDPEIIRSKINLSQDILERKEFFKKIPVDQSYPNYLIENIEKYKKWFI